MSQSLLEDGIISRINEIIDDCAERLQFIVGGKVVISWKQKNTMTSNEIEALQDIVCEVFGLQWQEISARKRLRHLVAARQIYSWFAYRRIGHSLSVISATLGQDHTTVISSLRKIQGYLETKDAMIYPKYQEVLKLFDAYAETKTEKARA